MRESFCACQEGIYGNDPSLFEMASQNLSSLFLIFSLCLHQRNDARFWRQDTRLPRSGVIHRLVISVTWSGAGGQTPVARRRFETVESEGS